MLGKWTFDNREISDKFEQHVKSQLSWYNVATKATVFLASHYLENEGLVYDIGSSSGNIDLNMSDICQSRNARFIPIEKSRLMADKHIGSNKPVVIDATDYNYKQFDVAILFLTLMFIEPSKRKELIEKLLANKKEGGCIIIVDKVEPLCGYDAIAFLRLTMQAKLDNGETHKDVIEKELSLAGIQRPINKSILPITAKTFFKYGDFEGFLIT